MLSRFAPLSAAFVASIVFVLAASTAAGAAVLSGMINALVVDPTDSAILYAGTTVGVYKSVDAGENWTRVDSGFPYPDVTALAIHPQAPCTVFAGLNSQLFGQNIPFPNPGFIPYNTSNLMMVTEDCGASWKPAPIGTGRVVEQLGFSSDASPLLMGVLTINTAANIQPWQEERILRGGGAVFRNTGGYPVGWQSLLAIDPSDPCRAYVGNISGEVWSSATCGFPSYTWSRIGVTPISGRRIGWVRAMAVHPTDHSLLVATADRGEVCCVSGGTLYRKSGNSGWTPILTLPQCAGCYIFTSIAFAPGNGNVAFMGDSEGRVLKSIDGGLTWNALTARLAGGTGIVAIGSSPVLRSYAASFTAVRQIGCHTGVDAAATTAPPDCAFTDPLLAPGAVAIKAAHISEPRSRIDRLRARYNLPAFIWDDGAIEAGVTVVRAQHLLDLRQALADVYTAAGLPVPTYTDADLAAGTIARGIHITELRYAVEALE